MVGRGWWWVGGKPNLVISDELIKNVQIINLDILEPLPPESISMVGPSGRTKRWQSSD